MIGACPLRFERCPDRDSSAEGGQRPYQKQLQGPDSVRQSHYATRLDSPKFAPLAYKRSRAFQAVQLEELSGRGWRESHHLNDNACIAAVCRCLAELQPRTKRTTETTVPR